MKNLTILFLLILNLTSCNKENSYFLYNYKSLSINIDSNNGKLQPLQVREYVFLKTNISDIIGCLSIEELDNIFEKYYKKKMDKNDFLFEFLNLKNEIPITYFEKLDLGKSLIKLDKIISESYRQKGISYLVNNFTYKSKSHSLTFKNNNLDLIQKKTVIYLFYTNHYDLHQDDYLAQSWFIKKKEFMLYW
ncbi:hypothetical protein CMU59_18630 [Elizabethkingia anophelis]|uniref:hypothetical protein n=1 Tax=Elizabethkingia anophelis TaxID=1117645 RepID=UPI0020121015|nr:hypothetical protein [Elizabethkingia anophelis]MCL1689665.1 hypothetical protein [Elizabethkingia anophelis]MDV3574718.1 hypothetical protein [Elizabethkingia anophelis]MDV3601531.1 hypothetical protein [Elizabethkingia anophelis]MDV3608533.1 hypothetical protein [Elizabethkingia anophelis]MDV3640654.1 hypothetical protein [Elizabethkingia anophelis]